MLFTTHARGYRRCTRPAIQSLVRRMAVVDWPRLWASFQALQRQRTTVLFYPVNRYNCRLVLTLAAVRMLLLAILTDLLFAFRTIIDGGAPKIHALVACAALGKAGTASPSATFPIRKVRAVSTIWFIAHPTNDKLFAGVTVHLATSRTKVRLLKTAIDAPMCLITRLTEWKISAFRAVRLFANLTVFDTVASI